MSTVGEELCNPLINNNKGSAMRQGSVKLNYCIGETSAKQAREI